MKQYLVDKDCIAFFQDQATPDFWDKHWETDKLAKLVQNCHDSYFSNLAKKYLPPGAGIIEGGCGQGQIVNSLKYNGFDAIGIDFAEKTVQAVNQAVPELDVRIGDVFRLKFDDNTFDGYISGGVIEHFWDGYDVILSEMQRVIKSGGYLFITVPAMSPLRQIKVKLGKYTKVNSNEVDSSKFYQFALNVQKLKSDLNNKGFLLKEQFFMDATKGIKDEISLLKPLLQKIYDGKFPQSGRIKRLMDKLFARFAGHIILLVMQKK